MTRWTPASYAERAKLDVTSTVRPGTTGASSGRADPTLAMISRKRSFARARRFVASVSGRPLEQIQARRS